MQLLKSAFGVDQKFSLGWRVHQGYLEVLQLFDSRAMHGLFGVSLKISPEKLSGGSTARFLPSVPLSVNPSLQSFPASSLLGPHRDWFSCPFSEGRGRQGLVVALVHEYKWLRQQTQFEYMAEQKPPRRNPNPNPLSLADKRELMWNFTQPGDPYDIRKSMIAKLPGQQRSMSGHLELVCLLQAAEIERLCQYLQEYKMRFREYERVELDRHSYEIQIRELTQKLAEESNYRAEIERLREFIRRQSAELQEMQGRRRYQGELERNYQDSLTQVAELKQVNSRIAIELKAAREQLVSLEDIRSREAEAERLELERRSVAFAQLQSKSRQSLSRWQGERRLLQQRVTAAGQQTRNAYQRIQQLQQESRSFKLQIQRLALQSAKVTQLTHAISEYQNRFTLLAEEIERLNGVLRDKSRELKEEQARGKQVAELLRVRTEQLTETQEKIRQLQQSNLLMQKQQRETLASLSTLQQTKSLTQSYEASLERLSIEVDRLNNVLRKKLNELQQARRKNNEAEIKLKTLQSLQRENADNKMRLAEVGRRMAEHEREAAAAIQENQRLNYSIKKLIEELNSMELRFKNAQKEIDNRQKTIDILSTQIDNEREQRVSLNQKVSFLTNENSAIREAISRHEDSKRIFQSKLTQYTGQVRRLQESLQEKDAQVGNLRNSKSENQLRLRQVESITQSDQAYIEQLLATNQQLQEQLNNIARENDELRAVIERGEQRDDLKERELISKQFEEISRLNKILAEREEEFQRAIVSNQQLLQAPSLQGLEELLHQKQLDIQNLQSQLKKAQEQLRAGQIALIEKQDVVQYYATDNQQYHAENNRLKNNLEERESRIERLENEIDRISRVVAPIQQGGEAIVEGEIGDARVRAQVQLGMLKERYILLQEQYEGSLRKMRDMQEELARVRYQLGTPAKKERYLAPQQTSASQGRETLQPSLSGDSLEVDENLVRELQFLRNRCTGLNEEAQRLKGISTKREEEFTRLQQQLEATERQLGQERSKQWRGRSPQKPKQEEESPYHHDYEDMLARYNILLSQHENLKHELDHRANLSQSQGLQLKRKTEQIAQQYNKILIFSQEIQRLNGILSNKEKEKQMIINDFKEKAETYERKIRQATILPPPSRPIIDDRQSLLDQTSRLRTRNLQLQQQIRELQSRAEQQLRFLQGKIQLLQKEIIRLNQILQVKVEECTSRQAQNRAARSQYQGKLALVGQQLQRLNGVLKLKVENYRVLQMEYHRYQEDAFRRINDQTQELHQTRDEVLRLNSQLQDLQSRDQHKNIQLQSIGQYQGKIIQQSAEIDRLSRLLLTSKQRGQQLQQKDARQLAQIERLNNSLRLKVEESILHQSWERDRQAEKQSFAAQLQTRIREYNSLTVRYRHLQEESSLNRQHLSEYEKRIKVLYEEFQRLQKIITALKKDNQEKSNSLNGLIEKNRYLGGELQRINKINKKQGEELGELRLSMAQDMSLQRRINEHLALFVVLFAEIESLRELAKNQQEELEEVRRENISARLV